MLLFSRYLLAILLLEPTAHYAGTDTRQDALKEFDQRTKEYQSLHKKIDGSLPQVKKEEDPAVILEREKKFAAAIRAARPNAAEGDIFVPAIRPIIREIIAQETSGPEGRKARNIILGDGNPRSAEAAGKVKLVVNGPYPSSAPLSTVPPSLLLKLPPLPDAVEYRFVGRSLILLETKAGLIVDILQDAIK